jgi:uncharacterized protein YdaU (DUF1376 family)
VPDELPYMRLWVNDLLGDPPVLAMTPEDFGVYVKLLCIAWVEGGIPVDPVRRARMAGITPRKLERIWPAMEAKWESNGNGHLVNPRQERERDDAVAAHQRRVKAGRKGGQSKAKAKG